MNEKFPDRRVIKDVLEEQLFNSGSDNDSDNETIGSENENTPESVDSSSDEDFDKNTDEADAHFLKWTKCFTAVLDNHDEELLKCTSFK